MSNTSSRPGSRPLGQGAGVSETSARIVAIWRALDGRTRDELVAIAVAALHRLDPVEQLRALAIVNPLFEGARFVAGLRLADRMVRQDADGQDALDADLAEFRRAVEGCERSLLRGSKEGAE